MDTWDKIWKWPNNHWSAFELGIKYKAFDREETDTYNAINEESWFAVEYSEIVMTTQISIVQAYYPFPDCLGDSCKGTLV